MPGLWGPDTGLEKHTGNEKMYLNLAENDNDGEERDHGDDSNISHSQLLST